MTKSMERGNSTTLMEINTRANTMKDYDMVEGCTIMLKLAKNTKVNGLREKNTAKEHTTAKTVKNSWVIITSTTCSRKKPSQAAAK